MNIHAAPWRAMKWMVVASIVLGVGFRLYHLDHKVFWEDEISGTMRMLGNTEAELVRASPYIRTAADVQKYFELNGAGRPLSATVEALAHEDPQHPPFYYLLVRIWVGWVGTSVLALRLLPAVFGILSIGAMYLLGRELFEDSRSALIAAALLALSPFAVLYSQEAREYSLWTLQTLVSSTLLLRAMRTGERRYWIGYGICSALGVYIDLLAALVTVAQGIFVLARKATRKWAVIAPYLLSSGAAAILFVPWIAAARVGVGTRGFSPMMAAKLPPSAIAMTFLRDLRACVLDLGPATGSLLRHGVTVAGVVVLALIAYAFWFLLFRERRGGRVRSFVLALLIVPALPLLGHDLLTTGMLVGQVRYFVPAYLAIALLLANLFEEAATDDTLGGLQAGSRAGAFALVLVGGAISCVISSQARTWYNKDYERTPAVAAAIASTQHPLVIGDLATSRVLGLSFYLPANTAMRVNLHCDVCNVRAAPPQDLAADAGHFSRIFILGTLPGGTASPGYVPVSYIGLQTFPPKAEPFNMFQSVYR